MVAGAVASNTTVSGVTLLKGADEDLTTTVVLNGGAITLSAGGAAYGLTVSSGAHVSGGGLLIGSGVDAGTITSAVLGNAVDSAYLEVSAFGVASAVTLVNGDLQVDEFGTVGGALVSGIYAFLDSYGQTTGTTVSAYANLYLESGASDTGATIGYGGWEDVGSYASATHTVVQSGGFEFAVNHASISNVTVSSGGGEAITAQVVIANVNVLSGGAAYFNQTVLNGQTVVAGAVNAATVISGITLQAGADEDVLSAVVSSGGTLTVSSGGEAYGVIVRSGGHVGGGGILFASNTDAGSISGVVIGTALLTGAVDVVSGGVASGLTIADGKVTVEIGGTVNSVALSTLSNAHSAGLLDDFGSATGTTVGSGASLVVESGAQDIGATISSGGYELIKSGGSASGTVISSGGEVEVQSGGSLNGLDLLPGGEIQFDGVSATWAQAGGGELELTSGYFVVASAGTPTTSPGEVFETTINTSGTLVTAVTAAAPTLGGASSAQSYSSLAAAVAVAPGITVSDANYNGVFSATVSITGGFHYGDQLSYLLSDSGDYNAVTGQLTLSGINSLAQYQQMLALVAFSSTAPDATYDGTDDTRTISFTVNNGVNSNTVTTTINVSPLSAPAMTAVDGATAVVSYASLGSLLAGASPTNTVISATLAAGSAGAGTLSLDAAHQDVDFLPAAGFAGTASAIVTVKDSNNVLYQLTLPIDVVVRAKPTSVASPAGTIIQVNGSQTTTSTYAPSGALMSTEVSTANSGGAVTTFTDGSGHQYAATIDTTLNGGGSEIQNFDGTWDQQSASITWPEGGGLTIEQSFNAAWAQTSATATTVNGNVTIIQAFDANWNQQSAERIDVEAGYSQTQYFDANWNQTSASLSFNLGGGAVKTQYFDAGWNQTSATLTTHPSAGQTEIQTFNAAWVQTSAEIITATTGQTTTQYFDAGWNQLKVTDDLTLTSGPFTDRLLSFDGSWNLLSEVDTQTNGAQDYVTYAQTGGGQTLAASSGHSTTFVFTPGTLNGDTLSGLNTLSLGGSPHDILDFEGYGANAALTQVNATTWKVSAQGDATETFQITGGGTLGDGDYQFIGAGSAITVLGADASAVASGSGAAGSAPSPASGVIAAGGAGQTLGLAQNETVYGPPRAAMCSKARARPSPATRL